jgi:polar amino acid transport system substrate-binding protein
MKKLGVLCALIFTFSAQAQEVKIITTDFCPFVCENSSDLGYAVDITKRVLERSGHNVSVTFASWARALESTRQGDFAAALSPAKTEAPDFIFPEEPIGVQRYCFFRREDSDWQYKGTASLKGQKIGALRDVSYAEITDWLEDRANAASVDFLTATSGTDQNFRKLVAGRLTILLEDDGVGSYYIKANNLKLAKAGCLAGEAIYFGLSPASPARSRDLAATFDAGIRALRASGELNAILMRYGVNDWK